MAKNVLVTGAYGRVGTAIIDQLEDSPEYDFTYLNRSDRPSEGPYGGYETVVADVANKTAIESAFEDQDAIIHLAGSPAVDSSWSEVLENNVIGMYNTLEAAKDNSVDEVIFGSSNHVVGMYELENAPDIYYPGSDLMVDHNSPVRPDSYYGTSKSFGEDLGRFYVENFEYPRQFYSLRIGSIRHKEYDHPYGDAERGVDQGMWQRGSEQYEEKVARMKAMWQSRRDFAHQIECCLSDGGVTFDVFYGVSDNDRRWFDIDHAREEIGYVPQDNGDEWNEPPSSV